MDSNEATTTSPFVGATRVAQGNCWNEKEEKKLAVEEKEAGEGHEPYS